MSKEKMKYIKMKKLLILLLCVPLIFSCGENQDNNKKVQDEEIESLDKPNPVDLSNRYFNNGETYWDEFWLIFFVEEQREYDTYRTDEYGTTRNNKTF